MQRKKTYRKNTQIRNNSRRNNNIANDIDKKLIEFFNCFYPSTLLIAQTTNQLRKIKRIIEECRSKLGLQLLIYLLDLGGPAFTKVKKQKELSAEKILEGKVKLSW